MALRRPGWYAAGMKAYAFGLAAAAAVGAGCSPYSAPGLKVTSVAIKDQTPAGTVLDFSIEASNRNEVELPLREVRYTLHLDGKEVFRGVRSPEASLRRLGVQTIHIPAVVPEGQSTGPGTRFVLEGQLGYTTPGSLAQVLFDIKVRRPKVGFREEGQLGAPPAP
jgi:hypothetical protein